MARYQRTEKRSDRKFAGYALGRDAEQPMYLTGHRALTDVQYHELLRAAAGPVGSAGFGKAEDYRIVSAGGQFYQVPDISASGGTDVTRP